MVISGNAAQTASCTLTMLGLTPDATEVPLLQEASDAGAAAASSVSVEGFSSAR